MSGASSVERNAEIVRRYLAGEGPRSISRSLGISHNVTAGVLHRYRNPGRGHPVGFRDLGRVRSAVRMADEIGLLAACRALNIDKGQLCRWRQALRSMEAA